jgi:hypothetical protein
MSKSGLAFPDPPLVKAPVAIPAWRAARDDGMKRAAKNALPVLEESSA